MTKDRQKMTKGTISYHIIDEKLSRQRSPDPVLEKSWIRIRSKSDRIRNPGSLALNVLAQNDLYNYLNLSITYVHTACSDFFQEILVFCDLYFASLGLPLVVQNMASQ